MNPINSRSPTLAPNILAPAVPTTPVIIPASSGLTVSSDPRAVTESTAGRKRSMSFAFGTVASGRRESIRRASSNPCISQFIAENINYRDQRVNPSQDFGQGRSTLSIPQGVESPEISTLPTESNSVLAERGNQGNGGGEEFIPPWRVNFVVMGVHSFLSRRDRINHSETCHEANKGYVENNLALAGQLQLINLKGVRKIDHFLNSKDSKSLSQACMMTGHLKSLVREYRYPTQGEIEVMIRDPQGDGQKLFGEVKLPSSILDSELTALINQGSLSRVTKLDLSNCINITNAGLLGLRGCRTLRSLDLSCCTGLTNGALRPLCGLNLEHVSLRSCTGISSNSELMSLCFVPLKSLDVSNCHAELTMYGVNRALRVAGRETFLHLEALNLSGGSLLTNDSLATISAMPIKMLDISGCHRVGDAGLASLSRMPLTSLNISGCNRITDGGLASLRQMPLASLDISGCSGISPSGQASLRSTDIKDLRI